MENTDLYFKEYIFRSESSGKKYYLPVLIQAEDLKTADAIGRGVTDLLNAAFNNLEATQLKRYSDPTFSMVLDLEEVQSFKICSVNLYTKKIESLGKEDFVIKSKVSIVPQNLQKLLMHNIMYHIDQSALLTTKIYDVKDLDKDFLILQFIEEDGKI